MRRKKLILETKITSSNLYGFNLEHFGVNQIFRHQQLEIFEPFEPMRENRFIIDLEIDTNKFSKKIPPSRVSSFKLFSNKKEKVIYIDTVLSVEDWIDDFLRVNICKIYLLNAIGEVLKMFDYDVINSGYEYGGNYNSEELFKPRIFYNII